MQCRVMLQLLFKGCFNCFIYIGGPPQSLMSTYINTYTNVNMPKHYSANSKMTNECILMIEKQEIFFFHLCQGFQTQIHSGSKLIILLLKN